MKIINLLLGLSFFFSAYSQEIKTEEKIIEDSNGRIVLNICLNCLSIEYEDDMEYHWYNEYSGLQSTKGGSGGSLLHGDFTAYDSPGNLNFKGAFNYGLKSDTWKFWDVNGDIKEIRKYEKGNIIEIQEWEKGNVIDIIGYLRPGVPNYRKTLTDENKWVEISGFPHMVGQFKKIYTKYDKLLYEETYLGFNKYNTYSIKEYYDGGGNIFKEYVVCDLDDKNMIGKYLEYHRNGAVAGQGHYYAKYSFIPAPISVKIDKWKWFDDEGNIIKEELYKEELDTLKSGYPSKIGSYLYDDVNDEWLKSGLWYFYVNGKDSVVNYERGIIIDE